MTAPLALRFLRSYADVDELKYTRSEIAIVGRSNVGKSSLLNALARNANLARTSKTPGATRLLNAFELGPDQSGRVLMDLPGYGYAKVSKKEKQRWADMVTRYLSQRESLVGVLHLIDGLVGPTKLDLEAVEWLRSLDQRIHFVATKVDKIRPSKRNGSRSRLCQRLGSADMHWVSAAHGTGIRELRRHIVELLR